ncbi:MAG TPA: DUF4113 domain-containing protein, partial [Sphingomonas sp.]|nr:DUF4113 domain-containing protein [Sphingomonas sp.]
AEWLFYYEMWLVTGVWGGDEAEHGAAPVIPQEATGRRRGASPRPHTNTHKRDRPQHHGTRRLSLHPMTDDSLELLAAARRGVEAAWRDGFAYTKAGIMLDDLVAAQLRPRTLFEGDVYRRARLMTALDEVNGRFGRFTAVPGAQGFKREWRMRGENKSPAWTTRIAEVPVVKA